MARCHVISQTTQVCPLQWLWMIDDVGHMSDVKYHLCIIINCFNSFNIPQPRWFVIFHFLTTSHSMTHSRLSISYMKRRSQMHYALMFCLLAFFHPCPYAWRRELIAELTVVLFNRSCRWMPMWRIFIELKLVWKIKSCYKNWLS